MNTIIPTVLNDAKTIVRTFARDRPGTIQNGPNLMPVGSDLNITVEMTPEWKEGIKSNDLI